MLKKSSASFLGTSFEKEDGRPSPLKRGCPQGGGFCLFPLKF
jgi:hypothetical protein